jgi:hypothetical protein
MGLRVGVGGGKHTELCVCGADGMHFVNAMAVGSVTTRTTHALVWLLLLPW